MNQNLATLVLDQNLATLEVDSKSSNETTNLVLEVKKKKK